MKQWTFNIFIFLAVLITFSDALPSPTPESPFSVSLRNSRAATADQSSNSPNAKFSLQESVARILRALASFGFGDQFAGPDSFTRKREVQEQIPASSSPVFVRQSQVEGSNQSTANFTQAAPAPSDIKSISAPDRARKSGSRVIVSQPLRITEGTRGGGRSLKNIDVQGVRVIVGQRVPDDPQDKFFTWRNARVIKGVLVPSEEDMKNALKKIATTT